MKYMLIILMLTVSCSSLPKEPKVSHNERVYRMCTEKETEDHEKYVCFRFCYESWFRTYCKLIKKERTSNEFKDFVLIHSSKLP